MSVQQSIGTGFTSRRGLITYSMFGSRNGSDGTGAGLASCRKFEKAGIGIQELPSTVTLGQQLSNNGFYRICRNESWDALPGDIVWCRGGADMSSSGGTGGHVGVMIGDTYFIGCDFSTQGRQASYQYLILEWLLRMESVTYIEVWKYLWHYPRPQQPSQYCGGATIKAYYEVMKSNMSTAFCPINVTIWHPLDSTGGNSIPVSMKLWVDADETCQTVLTRFQMACSLVCWWWN